jgi:hypothetical protein
LLRFARNDGSALLLLGFTLLARPADADQTSTPPDPKEQANLQGFAAAHPECAEWSDGCAVCMRSPAVHCSTPGIACEPADIVCKAP